MKADKRTAVLLVNLGSPDSPAPRDVRRYLTQFLNDPRVIDIPWLWRKILVNGIIVPFRYRKSAAAYSKLWTADGSPLVHYGWITEAKLQKRFDENSVKVFLAMRYQNPSMESALAEIMKWRATDIVLIPLFPQYASASSGSVIEHFFKLMSGRQAFQHIRVVSQFYDHPLFVRGIIEKAAAFVLSEYDHIIFSYHGLPERQLDALYDDKRCASHDCDLEVNADNAFCYKATCFDTTRRIASGLGLTESQYTVSFQSRLGKGWIEPFTDDVIKDLAAKGVKKLLVFSPAFVADCLETTIEISEEYQELFESVGGHKIQLVPGLNESDTWISLLEDIVKSGLRP
jgi:ferrochelatase